MIEHPRVPEEYTPDKFATTFNSDDGKKLWHVLTQPAIIDRMITASDLGQPALKPVEDVLLEQLGPAILSDRMKQMAGHMVRQIMECNGFEHDTDGIRIASIPFYKASRYRRANSRSLFVFRDRGDARQFAMVSDREGGKLPGSPSGKGWTYYNVLVSPLKSAIGFGVKLDDAIKKVVRDGYCLARQERILRAANSH